jgi:hypothetical protein
MNWYLIPYPYIMIAGQLLVSYSFDSRQCSAMKLLTGIVWTVRIWPVWVHEIVLMSRILTGIRSVGHDQRIAQNSL